MNIVDEILVKKVSIEYDILSGEDRELVLRYLDETYGEGSWRAVRSGPMASKVGTGLIIAEIGNVQEQVSGL